MVYVAVQKNDQDEWVLVKYLTSTIGQRSLVTGYTLTDITKLDANGRLEHGFWIQEDIYIGTGEFSELEKKEVVMDDVEGKLINTYTYKLMDLSIIKDEMKNRVRSYRSLLSNSRFTKDGHEFDMSLEGRCELQGFVIESLIDPSIEMVSIRLQSGEDVTLSVLELKELYIEIATYRDGLFDKEAELIDAIDAALDYDAIRLAAHWDGQEL